jgi:hypothetical protein
MRRQLFRAWLVIGAIVGFSSGFHQLKGADTPCAASTHAGWGTAPAVRYVPVPAQPYGPQPAPYYYPPSTP